MVGPGTPDVNITTGWIELKKLDGWPAKDETPLRVPTYTPQQKIWALKRARAGGRVWMLIQVGKDFVLLDGVVAANVLGSSTRQQLIDAAIAFWPNRLNEQELLRCVS